MESIESAAEAKFQELVEPYTERITQLEQNIQQKEDEITILRLALEQLKTEQTKLLKKSSKPAKGSTASSKRK